MQRYLLDTFTNNEMWIFYKLILIFLGYNPQAEDVPTVVKIHNSVNEQCWREVMEFEKMHG